MVLGGPFRLVRTGEEDKDVVHLAVPVVVVGGEIDEVIHGRAGIHDHLGGVLVLPVAVVGPVPGEFPGEGDDVRDVEAEGIAVLPLVLEVGQGRLGVVSVDDPLEIVPGEGIGKVGELGEDDKPVADAVSSLGQKCPGAGELPFLQPFRLVGAAGAVAEEEVVGNDPAGGDDVAGRVGKTGPFPGVHTVAIIVVSGIAPPSLGVLDERAAVGGLDQMAVLISGQEGGDEGSIGLPQVHLAPECRRSR